MSQTCPGDLYAANISFSGGKSGLSMKFVVSHDEHVCYILLRHNQGLLRPCKSTVDNNHGMMFVKAMARFTDQQHGAIWLATERITSGESDAI